MKKILLIVLVVSAVIGWFIHNEWVASPKYSLSQIAKSFDSHDVALFEKHVDLETLLGRAVDDFMAISMSDTNANESLGDALAAGMVAMMKPKLVSTMKSQIIQAVEGENSTLSSNADSSDHAEAHKLSRLFTAEENGLELKYINEEGSIAFLGFEKHDSKLNGTITIEAKMRKLADYWQIVEVSNIDEIIKRQSFLEQQRLAELNAPTREAITNAFAIHSLSKRNKEERWDKKVYLSAQVENHSNKMIKATRVRVTVTDPAGNKIKSINLNASDIGPGETDQQLWSIDINQFISDEKKLYDLPSSDAKFEVEIQKVEFSDGETLQIQTSI